MKRTTLTASALTGALALSLTTLSPVHAGKPATSKGTVVSLTSAGCTFTATATWTRTDVTHAYLYLLRTDRKTRHTASNGVEAVVDESGTSASYTWARGSGSPADFQASVALRAGDWGTGTTLEQRRSMDRVRAACELVGN